MFRLTKPTKIRLEWTIHTAPKNIIRGQGPSLPNTPENVKLLKGEADKMNKQFPNSHSIGHVH